MRNKMRFLNVLLLAVIFTIIVGCSSDSSSSENRTNNSSNGNTSGENNKGESGEVVELSFWDMSWGPSEYITAAEEIVDQFNREHPDINVTYQSTPWANWYQTFTTAIASGTAPDISTGAGFQAFQFYGQDAILPIDDVIEEWEAEGKLDDFYPGTIEAMQYDGHYLALPWGLDTRVYWYRKDLFEDAGVEVPTNWEEFREAANQLTDGDGQYGLAIEGGANNGIHTLFTLIFNNGGGIFTEDRHVELVNNELNQEAIQFLADLQADGSINPASPGMGQDDALNSFGQGNAALYLGTPGTRGEFPEITDEVGILPALESPNGNKGTVMWVNNIMLYKQTEHPEEAKTFLKWWSENQLPLWTEGNSNQLPARVSFSEEPYFQEDQDYKFVYDEYIPNAFTTSTYFNGSFPELNEIEGDGVLQSLAQQILSGKDVMSAMEEAEGGLQDIMGE
ncbi:ABC transporter substrate-binding protein [Gracilibacillus saliphilus]|uniref:ABC transporter substrate-binding protein n=1 Tax=Gracilibacillus saliphilus TaxID=543890 RepID=UPI0013D00CAB|nr:sugar ABC transporter substrate-binding protein [Gracilibacillus saliphilus]